MYKNRYDLIVVGGGFAGAAAAISAAKKGVTVLLIEKYNCLGGAAANALVMPFMGYSTNNIETNEKEFLCGDIFLEIIREMNKLPETDGSLHNFDEEYLKLVLNRMALKYGVNLLFDATVIETKVENKKINSVKVFGKSKIVEFYADYFIDATGDAELSMLSGCSYKVGREKDGLCQPMTLCFRMSGINKSLFQKNARTINQIYKEFQKKGLIKNPREDILFFNNYNEGVLHFNTTRIIKMDPTNPFDVTKAEIEAREQVFEIYNFLRENIEGFEHARVLSTALQIGIRESRKIEGEYTLTQEDLISLARFEDAIAVANYDIDIHNPEGTGTSHHYFGNGEWYEIPYRCLIPKNMNNMLVAGRCISSTHEAQASYRIMPFCSELGQAAGTAIAVAVKNKTDVRSVDIKQVQEILRREGFKI